MRISSLVVGAILVTLGLMCVLGALVKKNEEGDSYRPWLAVPSNHYKSRAVAGDIIALIPGDFLPLCGAWLGYRTARDTGRCIGSLGT